MGAFSTLRITQTKARAYLLNELLRMSDSDIEAMLDDMLERRLYRVRIVSDDEEENDDAVL